MCIRDSFDTVGDEANGIAADHCVTVRERDTMQQVRMPISEMCIRDRAKDVSVLTYVISLLFLIKFFVVV